MPNAYFFKGLLYLFLSIISWVISFTLKKIVFNGPEFNFDKPFMFVMFSEFFKITILLTVFFDKVKMNEIRNWNKEQFLNIFDLSIKLELFLFGANMFGNFGLSLTDVGTSFVLLSTSIVFVFFFSLLILKDKFNLYKLALSLICFGGTFFIAADSNTGSKDTILGYILLICGSSCNALYSVSTKKLYDANIFGRWLIVYGIGGIVPLFFTPLFYILNWTNLEIFELPSLKVLGFLIVNALLESVCVDYFFSKSFNYLHPLLVEVGFSISGPLGLIVNMIIFKIVQGFLFWGGALIIFVSFILFGLVDYYECFYSCFGKQTNIIQDINEIKENKKEHNESEFDTKSYEQDLILN